MLGREEDSLEFLLVSINWGLWVRLLDIFYCTNKWFYSKMPPHKDHTNANPSNSNAHNAGPSGDNQFQNFMQMMMKQ